MPIYEFYCSDCNTLFNFFSARIDTRSAPACPRCGRDGLERRPARFATLSHHSTDVEDESAAGDPFAGLDEKRLDGLMDSMMRDMEGVDEQDDPRQLAHIFRRFGDAAGLEPGPRLEEVLARLEAGEDPDELEGDLDDTDDSLEDLFRFKRRLSRAASRRPSVDETLYFL